MRSIPLDARTARLHEHLDQLRDSVNRERVLAVWDRLVVTPRWPGPPMWIHGDLHPGNLLVHDGELTAVLDFGDVAAGDPATDFAVMWMLLPPQHREAAVHRVWSLARKPVRRADVGGAPAAGRW